MWVESSSSDHILVYGEHDFDPKLLCRPNHPSTLYKEDPFNQLIVYELLNLVVGYGYGFCPSGCLAVWDEPECWQRTLENQIPSQILHVLFMF